MDFSSVANQFSSRLSDIHVEPNMESKVYFLVDYCPMLGNTIKFIAFKLKSNQNS